MRVPPIKVYIVQPNNKAKKVEGCQPLRPKVFVIKQTKNEGGIIND